MNTEIKTTGGTSIGGAVHTGGGQFVGRDQIIINFVRSAENDLGRNGKFISASDIVDIIQELPAFSQVTRDFIDALQAKSDSLSKESALSFLYALQRFAKKLSALNLILIVVYYPEVTPLLHNALERDLNLLLTDTHLQAMMALVPEEFAATYDLVDKLKKDLQTLKYICLEMPNGVTSTSENEGFIDKLLILPEQLNTCNLLFSRILRDNWSLKEL
ncbi:MAG: hypothetical protein ACOYNY_11435 [Caldilineaceae bacterium]